MSEVKTDDPKSIATEIASELRKRPWRWLQGSYLEHHVAMGGVCTHHCLAGFIYARYPEEDDRRMATRMDFEKAAMRIERSMISLGSWNDEPVRTVDDVIALCDKVAAS